ncbi:MAG: thermonuclease family protein [Rhodospirillales bacterium]|jgi:endonuclease YncB( thermonuclease family)
MKPLVPLVLLLLSATAQAAPGQCRAVDGDSYNCFGERIRVENIDTPELHGKCDRETQLAKAAKNYAQTSLDKAEQVVVTIHEKRPRDKYGRTLWPAPSFVDTLLIYPHLRFEG